MTDTPATRFGINPGPLKIVTRRALATQWELSESVRCKAITRQGHRCERVQEPHSDYCWQHPRRDA
jgi:hypothetical protein